MRYAHIGVAELVSAYRADRYRAADRGDGAQGNREPLAVHARCRSELSDTESSEQHLVRRRKPANQSGQIIGKQSGRIIVRIG